MKLICRVGVLLVVGLMFNACDNCESETVKIIEANFANTFRIAGDAQIFLQPDSSNATLEGLLPVNNAAFQFGTFRTIFDGTSDHALLRSFLTLEPKRSKCNIWFGNAIDSSSYKITCSRSFIFNGITINPTDNLLDLKAKDGAPAILMPIWEAESLISCLIRNVFFNEGEFEKREYGFNIEFDTDDSIHINSFFSFNFL